MLARLGKGKVWSTINVKLEPREGEISPTSSEIVENAKERQMQYRYQTWFQDVVGGEGTTAI